MIPAHGGDRLSFMERYGRLPLDFSASVSPLGMPEAARRAAAGALADCSWYPDPECRELRQSLAEKHGIPASEILCGNGASDLIERLVPALAPGNALIPVPTYVEYRRVLERCGCEVREYPLSPEQDFRLDRDFLSALTPDLDLVILCEPGNPSGRMTDRALLEEIVRRCGSQGIFLLADECFIDFLDDPEAHSLLKDVGRHRLLVLRAFTKFYGMAGLRLGWCACGDRELLARMREAGPPWPVSTPALAAGTAALKDDCYAEILRELIRVERDRLFSLLQSCGCRVIPGEANYLLFYCPDAGLGEKLAARGILLRDCRNFSGLVAGWYRTAVRLPEENDRLIRALKAVIS